ncbi:MAG TPA: DUF6179 domain-containing protein [Mobilitalea sp.]|nr:DUF6179 domain-containing protein [Mobilitalea sp.]
MDFLEKEQLIDEKLLDHGHYFQSFFLEVCRKNLISNHQMEKIQMELVELMGKEVERFTNDESSSIPIEKAQDILQSITYNIGYFLKTTTDMTQKLDNLKLMKISELYYKGMEGVTACRGKAEQLLKDIQKNAQKFNNYAYQDTIFTGLPEFFYNYNMEFGAHDIPGCFDYPLITTITDLLGVEFIYEFLRRLSLEQGFLSHYSELAINRLLKSFEKEAEHMLINIYELVLTNALACALLGKDSKELTISTKELDWLYQTLLPLNMPELTDKLFYAFQVLQEELLLEPGEMQYTIAEIPQIAQRLEHNLQTNTLDKIFLPSLEVFVKEEFYEDGQPMEDDRLRELIEKLRGYRLTSDKVAIMKDTVRSQADFIELLNECFYDEEYEEVFASLNEIEKAVLKKSILLESGQKHYEDYEPMKEWQRLLFQME